MRVWTDSGDEQLRDRLNAPLASYHQRTANLQPPPPPSAQELYDLHQSQAINWGSLMAEELEKLVQEASTQDLKS